MSFSYNTRSVTRKNLNNKIYYISENDNFNVELENILNLSNIGDIIHYITNNQEGYKIFKIVQDYFKKDIKEIGNIYDLYNDDIYE